MVSGLRTYQKQIDRSVLIALLTVISAVRDHRIQILGSAPRVLLSLLTLLQPLFLQHNLYVREAGGGGVAGFQLQPYLQSLGPGDGWVSSLSLSSCFVTLTPRETGYLLLSHQLAHQKVLGRAAPIQPWKVLLYPFSPGQLVPLQRQIFAYKEYALPPSASTQTKKQLALSHGRRRGEKGAKEKANIC